MFLANGIVLGWVGANPPEGYFIVIGQIATAYYFLHLLVLIPLVGMFEKPRPLPKSISEPVLKGGGRMKRMQGLTSVLKTLTLSAAMAAGLGFGAQAAGDAKTPADHDWSFEGIFGTFERASAQRGLQVYLEVCAACHALEHLPLPESR